jgi:hypothetical protein
LAGWQQDDPSAPKGHPDDGASALDALVDIGFLRHLLDQAELAAVRTARRHRRSWAEIATKLGVSRQSAWERWRDLDDDIPGRPDDDDAGGKDTTTEGSDDDAVSAATAELVRRAWSGPTDPEQVTEWAHEHRRRSSVVVPNVVGLPTEAARLVLQRKKLIAVGPDQDGPPITALGRGVAVVVDQSPESGAKVPAGSPVTLWVERGGGSGVREPRRPNPAPRSGREMKPEPT